MAGVIRLDPLQRLTGVSFGGNRLAILYAFGGRSNAFIPPQVRVSMTKPVAFTLIDSGSILPAAGTGSGSASIEEEITGDMLRAFKAWRYASVEAFSDGHADLIGIHTVVAINLGKFPPETSSIDVEFEVARIGSNFNRPDIALSTFRNVWHISLLSEGIGNAIVGGDFVARAGVSPENPGPVTGSINLRTLAVTLEG